MRNGRRFGALGALVLAGAFAVPSGSAMAAVPGATTAASYTCAGGEIPSGTYARITATGPCSVAEDAVITVIGNVDVAAGAMFDAQSVPSTITVGRNVTGAAGSLVGLGCQPPAVTGNSAHPCVDAMGEPTDGVSHITVGGNVTVTDAMAVLLNGITVRGNVTLTGGGSPIPWSIKNNTVAGNITMSGQDTEWVGVMFNRVGKNVTLTDIALSDPHPGAPGVYIVRNTIGRNLVCTGLTPGVSGGFVPGSVNVVGRNAVGQCAGLV